MIPFLIKYIHFQTEMVEHAKFYSMTRLKIYVKFIRRLAFDLIYSDSDSYPDRCRILYQEMLFFQNYAAFFISMIKEEFQKNFVWLVFILCNLFIDQVSCIINNRNILTNGRWRCYNEMGQRICYRYSEL